MRQGQIAQHQNNFSILTLDDDPIMTSTLQAYFQRSGYHVDVENDPHLAIELVRNGSYDILLLDFLMTPICGDQVVAQIRAFNQEIFIILLTGHKSMAPPIKTIRGFDIQGYYEKSDRFDQLELLVESCVKSIQQIRTIRSYQHGLAAIVEELPTIYSLQSMAQIADRILLAITSILQPAHAFFTLDPTLFGLCTPDPSSGPSKCLLRRAGTAFTDARILELVRQFQGGSRTAGLRDDNFLVAPVLNERGVCVGLLGVAFEEPPKFEQMQLLDLFAKQIAAAFRNAILHSLVNAKNDELTRAYNDLHDSYLEMVSVMRLMVDAKDIYTRGHSDRVSYYAVKIAERMGKDAAYCERLRVAGLFHDVGKLSISDAILLKREPLTRTECRVIKAHSARGADILSAISKFCDIVPIVRGHHERYGGGGYP
ncbi:MAG: DUF3369 domain-containing protein, partial [Clostridiales bacterium]|nr:DUF3369 domain-containing protein [Clostridiales bacterium]